MLTNLQVHNFAIAEHIDMDFHRGLTVITGETGAGKSILLDAIGLALGDRADSSAVGNYADRSEIIASFDTQQLAEVNDWLQERDLDDSDSCVLRRVIRADGKSKAYINNRPSPLSDLRELGEKLINIHGQHAHQKLLNKQEPLRIVDQFGDLIALRGSVKSAYQAWQQQQQLVDDIKQQNADSAARIDYLRYQLAELEPIALTAEQLDALEQELELLRHSETLAQACQDALAAIDADDGSISRIHLAQRHLSNLPIVPDALNESLQLMESAMIQLQEATDALNQQANAGDIDEQRLHELDQQLSAIYVAAKKYQTAPADLTALVAQIHDELSRIDVSDEQLAELEANIIELKTQYDSVAGELTAARQATANTLGTAIEARLQALSMGSCRVVFDLVEDKPSSTGNEKIELNVATNPGQTPQHIGRVASGGELSRIGLAIQVVTAQRNQSPAMIFDEVDSGVGGAVAEVVGNVMRELSDTAQIFCVTHLAQVASKGHNHYRVQKETASDSVKTDLVVLDDTEQVEEIARMIGGLSITDTTRSHAKQMLASA